MASNENLNNCWNILLKICMVTMCIICYLQYYSNSKYEYEFVEAKSSSNTMKKTYINFEKEYSLCQFHSPQNYQHFNIQNCPKSSIVSVQQGGRLGNQIWEYISVWLVAKNTGLEPYVPSCLKLRLSKLLDNLTLPSFEGIRHCPIEQNVTVTRVLLNNQSIILPACIVQPELLAERINDINQVFRIKKNLLDLSQKILHSSVQLLNSTFETFIGVHARRTDYLSYLKRKYKTVPKATQFFEASMKYFELKYPKVIFIFVSDDPGWCWKNFGYKKNVFVTGKRYRSSPELDIAIMASCNHSIIDYGTFGQWGALFAGGETLFYEVNSTYSSDKLGKHLDNWNPLDVKQFT